ncbi:hypothetical protein, partial [Polaromonas eurypsychrophila]
MADPQVLGEEEDLLLEEEMEDDAPVGPAAARYGSSSSEDGEPAVSVRLSAGGLSSVCSGTT